MVADFNIFRKIAILQALYKLIAREVSTKEPENLRAKADKLVEDSYIHTGAKTFDLRICGEKVGVMSARIKKGEPATKRVVIDDIKAFDAWALAEEHAHTETVMVYSSGTAQETAQRHFCLTGEIPAGTSLRDEPAIPDHIDGTVLKVDAEKVTQALASHGELDTAIKGLLERG